MCKGTRPKLVGRGRTRPDSSLKFRGEGFVAREVQGNGCRRDAVSRFAHRADILR